VRRARRPLPRHQAQDHLLLTVVEAHCRYVAPARYDDEVIAEARVAFSHSRMIGFAYEIRNAATSQLLVSGETKHVFITPDGRPAGSRGNTSISSASRRPWRSGR